MRRVEITRLSAGEGGGSAFESCTVFPGDLKRVGPLGEGVEVVVSCRSKGGLVRIIDPDKKTEVFKFKNQDDIRGERIDASRKIGIKGNQGVLISTEIGDVAIQGYKR